MTQPATQPEPHIAEVHDTASVRDLVARCRSDRTPIADYGPQHAQLGHPPPAEAMHLAWRLDDAGILEHHRADFTLRVAAGAPFGPVQRALRKAGQFLPIDADEDMTLGEIVSAHVWGPLRASYPSIRDLLLGLSFVDGQARVNTVGGRTVKNVAGYDLTRFMAGGLGQFGLLTELTLRSYPLPPHTARVDLRVGDLGELEHLFTEWLISDAAPSWLAMTRRDPHWLLHVGYFGPNAARQAQLESLKAMIKPRAGLNVHQLSHRSLDEDAAERAAMRAWRREAPAVLKLMIPPATLLGLLNRLAPTDAEAVADLHSPQIEVLPLHGGVFLGGDLDVEQAAALVPPPGDPLHESGSVHAWLRRPEPDAERLPPFGPPQPDWPMMQKLKAVLDPDDLLNRDRFLPAAQPTA